MCEIKMKLSTQRNSEKIRDSIYSYCCICADSELVAIGVLVNLCFFSFEFKNRLKSRESTQSYNYCLCLAISIEYLLDRFAQSH